jgi:hypothetical protein
MSKSVDLSARQVVLSLMEATEFILVPHPGLPRITCHSMGAFVVQYYRNYGFC